MCAEANVITNLLRIGSALLNPRTQITFQNCGVRLSDTMRRLQEF